MSAKSPDIDLQTKHVICDRHGEVFRDAWPAGYPLFAVKAMHIVLESKELIRQCRGKIERTQKLLNRRPLCCRLPRDTILSLYQDCANNTEFGSRATCDNCKRTRLGAPYRTRNPQTLREQHYKHMCFECVLDNMRPLEAN